jgi:hypothetical protein
VVLVGGWRIRPSEECTVDAEEARGALDAHAHGEQDGDVLPGREAPARNDVAMEVAAMARGAD